MELRKFFDPLNSMTEKDNIQPLYFEDLIMARRKKLENEFPQDREDELLDLLRGVGHFEDLDALADYFETNRYAVAGFLKTDRAKAAAAQYKGGRDNYRKLAIDSDDSTDYLNYPGEIDKSEISDGYIIEEPIEEEVDFDQTVNTGWDSTREYRKSQRNRTEDLN